MARWAGAGPAAAGDPTGSVRRVSPGLVVLAGGRGSRFGGDKQLTPVGPAGEAILEYTVADARAAGFTAVVVVTRSELAAGVAARVDATIACQDRDPLAVAAAASGRAKPLGTVHAALVGMRAVPGRPVAVANADDLYAGGTWGLLAEHLGSRPEGALVTFPLADTITGDEPVTRALCDVSPGGELRGIEEGVVSGGRWVGGTGRVLAVGGDEPVSMNCWGFPAAFVDTLDAACRRFAGGPDDELLLPDVVSAEVAAGRPFAALSCTGRCVGLTHPGDVEIVRHVLAARRYPGRRGGSTIGG
jgi:hypothetical protein